MTSHRNFCYRSSMMSSNTLPRLLPATNGDFWTRKHFYASSGGFGSEAEFKGVVIGGSVLALTGVPGIWCQGRRWQLRPCRRPCSVIPTLATNVCHP